MAFPLPGQFGASAGSPVGTANYFTPQPNDYQMLWPPLRTTGGGVYEDGLPGVVLIWNRLTQEQFAALQQHFGTASGTAQAGNYHVSYWNERASGGAGAYQTAKCRPRPPQGSLNQQGQYYVSVRWQIDALGVA